MDLSAKGRGLHHLVGSSLVIMAVVLSMGPRSTRAPPGGDRESLTKLRLPCNQGLARAFGRT